LGFGERTNDVDGDDFPWGLWDFIWLERGFTCLGIWFDLLTLVASANIFGDVFTNGGPVVLSEYEISGSTDSRVSCKWVIMVLLDNLFAEWVVFWNVEEIFVQKYTL